MDFNAMKTNSFLIIVFSIIFFSACIKEKAVDANYIEVQLPTDLTINQILQQNDSTLLVAAGNRFGAGSVLRSTDYGENWIKVLDGVQDVRSIRLLNSRIYALPIGNTFFWSDNNGQSWQSLLMPGWEFFSAATFLNDYSGILVGGENFGKGIVHTVYTGAISNLLSVDTIQHELTDITNLNDSSIIAVGYGVILRSEDKGISWIPDKTRGDFFKAVDFPDSITGYVAGDYGSLHKTTDGGKSWKKIKNSSTFFNKNNRFNDISFINNKTGAIVGKNGLVWYTNNGGDTWIPIHNIPKTDLKSVFVNNLHIIVGTENGKLLLIDKP